MKSDCKICTRIQEIKDGANSNFVKGLSTGYVVLNDFQYYPGYVLFLSKIHATELHELPGNLCQSYLNEMALVAKAVYSAFRPIKLNYELLGNGEPHLHWHIIPRYSDDPNLKEPIWVIDKAIRYDSCHIPSKETVEKYREKLLKFI